MEGLGSMKIEQYRCLSFDQTTNVQRDHVGSSTGTSNGDCGAIDPCSPFYRSYLRAVRFLAEQCENFFCDPTYGLEKFIKDIMVGKIAPNQDGFVMLAPVNDRTSRPPGVWLDEKPARLIREVQRDFDLKNDAKYFGQFTTACGRTLDQVRNQFFVDCYAECVQPPGSRMKANTTECVPVPSSEHVAEIVGKKGGKIKNIRAETNTYIKTPKRDEEPVFVITGRKEDVGLAKQKILAAAEHFTQLREARRQNPGGPVPVVGPPKRDGDVTVSVEVPYEFVGLVVGQKGATIKRIQQDTNTYITTPSRRHRPIFEVVGQPLEVERAREAIRAHIDSRVEKFRAEGMAAATAAGSGPGSCSSLGGFGLGGGGGGYPTTSPPSMSPFLGYDDAVFGGSGGMGVSSSGSLQQPRRQTPSAADISLFSAPFGSSGSGVSWSSGAAGMCSSLRAPPPVTGHQLPPPQHPPPSCNGGRLSAFRQLPLESCSSGAGVADSLSALNAGLRQLSFSSAADSMAVSSTAGGMANSCWLPERSSCSLPPCSIAGGDPADPPVMSRRLSDDDQQQRDIGSVLFNFPGHLGWSSAGASTTATAPLASLDQQQQYLQHQLQQQQHQVQQTASISSIIGSINKGSSETLNSDSGVELTTPPPMLDGAAFGPIGSKRTSPASIGSD